MRKNAQLHELLNHMLEQGLRVTAQRKEIFALILHFEHSFTAMDMHQTMEKKFPGLSYGTVYQNLKLYTKLRFIETFAMKNEVRYRYINREQPQFHFICMDCEKTILVDFNPAQVELPLPQRFRSVNYQFDVFGYCIDCGISAKESPHRSVWSNSQ